MPLTIIIFITAVSFCLMSMPGLAESSDNTQDRIVASWLEKVVITTPDKTMTFRAKLDTGANTSSLHALDIKQFEKEGEPWVNFKTQSLKEGDSPIKMSLPVKRVVKIKRHFRPAQERPVVEMTFCLDSRVYTAEFSLVDRNRFNYPVLLGRRFLKQGILVDPGTTYTLEVSKKSCLALQESKQEKKIKKGEAE